ncbi:hypothetical protein [Flavobacterium tructae]|uniref:hypothetical protein n=1 Tax=Flavobacterium tructae TaxID=1114873 RepID=UPI0035A8A3D9
MKTIKEMNFTELDSTQMKQVKGGGLLNDALALLNQGKPIWEVARILGVTVQQLLAVLV